MTEPPIDGNRLHQFRDMGHLSNIPVVIVTIDQSMESMYRAPEAGETYSPRDRGSSLRNLRGHEQADRRLAQYFRKDGKSSSRPRHE